MAIKDINDAEIREYLLGMATPETAERLDELSFTDGFAERIGGTEHDLIGEYLAGGLPAEETRAFESYYLSSPLRREKVDFARVFAAYAERSRPAAVVETKASFWDGLSNWRLAFQFGIAAAGLLLMAVFGWFIYRSGLPSGDSGPTIALDLGSPTPASAEIRLQTPEPGTPQTPDITPSTGERPNSNRPAVAEPKRTPSQPKPAPPGLAIFTLTPALRSSSFQTVKLPAGAAEFRLRLETEVDGPFTGEIVELRGQARVWAARSLAVSGRDAERTASFRVPAGTIRPGEHRVTVFARGSGGQQEKVGDYFVRVAP